MNQYKKGTRIRYQCPACGKRVTGTVDGVQWFPQVGLVLATCDACGSTTTVARIPKTASERAK